MSVEVFIISLHAVGASSLTGAINLMVTCTYARRVHTTLLQVSLYPWSVAGSGTGHQEMHYVLYLYLSLVHLWCLGTLTSGGNTCSLFFILLHAIRL
jgi:hypothetical protein